LKYNRSISATLFGILCLLAFRPETSALDCNLRSLLNQTLTNPESELRIDLKPKRLELRPFNRSILNDLENGIPYSYYVDTLDQIHFVKGEGVIQGAEDFLTLQSTKGKSSFVIKEAGTFRLDREQKVYLFDPKKGWDLSPDETKEIMAAIKKENPGITFKRKANPMMDRAKTLSCIEILSAAQGGKSFVWDNLVSSNIVSMAGVVTQELSGNHLITDPEKRKLMYADLIASNVSTLITSPIVKRMIVSNSNVVKDFATRTATDFATNIAIKKPIYDYMTGNTSKQDKEKASMGKKLIPYDTGFGVVRFFPKRALDRALMNQIPQLMVSACMHGNELAARVGPKMIRIADRYTWGIIYLTGRNQYLEMNK